MHSRTLLVATLGLLSCTPDEAERRGVSRAALTAPQVVELNLNLGPNTSSDPETFVRFGDAGVAFFASRRGVGRELFVTDGTDAGTRLVRDVNPGTGSAPLPLSALGFVGGRLAFGANDGTRDDLWLSDGTATGTRALTRDGGWRALPATLPNGLYFVSGPALNSQAGLFRLDPGATDATRIASLTGCNAVPHFAAGTSRLGFVCDGFLGGPQPSLWLSDGTTAGTVQVEMNLGTVGVLAWNGDTLWYATSTALKRIDSGSSMPTTVATLTATPRRIVFAGNVTWLLTTASLLRIEGTTVGTMPSTVCATGDLVSSPVAGEALLLPCFNATTIERVSLDAGTEPVASGLSTPRKLVRLDTRVAYRSGNSLCTLDGTDAGSVCGTYLFDSDTFEAAEFAGRVFFE
ncbi:MAG TPA: hypothetical protein VGD87_12480, partial [Archangium sp.]